MLSLSSIAFFVISKASTYVVVITEKGIGVSGNKRNSFATHWFSVIFPSWYEFTVSLKYPLLLDIGISRLFEKVLPKKW